MCTLAVCRGEYAAPVQPLSAADASFLYLETSVMHLQVCTAVVLDDPDGRLTIDRVREIVRERLPAAAPLRRRLVPATLRLHHPYWEEVADLDLDLHVRPVSCPAPGTDAELEGVVARFASRPLDRSRPLWQMLVVRGLSDHRVALLLKMHHSAADGVAAAGVLVNFFDLEAHPAMPFALSTLPAASVRPGAVTRFRRNVEGVARYPLTAAKLVPSVAGAVAGLVKGRVQGGSSGAAVPFTAPRVSFNGAISARRSVAFCELSLQTVKDVKSAFGATVNEVLLAVCAGALRHYLADRGELPDSPLVVVIPVSIRAPGETGGNRTSAMFARLPVNVADPVERLAQTAAASRAGKTEHEAIGTELVSMAAELLPPVTAGLVSRLYSAVGLADRHPVVHNLVMSNVPGPPVQLWFGGCPVRSIYPLGPVLEGAGLNITALSVNNRIGIGFIACADTMPRPQDLAAGMETALQELADAAAQAAQAAGA